LQLMQQASSQAIPILNVIIMTTTMLAAIMTTAAEITAAINPISNIKQDGYSVLFFISALKEKASMHLHRCLLNTIRWCRGEEQLLLHV